MKAFALLCLVVAVQGRVLDVPEDQSRAVAQRGENPWLVHLRVTRSTGGGLLDTGVGSLIGTSWVLTAASAVQDARFIWIRYGAVDPFRPELVTETSVVQLHPDYSAVTGDNNIALVSINRLVQSTANISPVALAAADSEAPSAGRSCGFGGDGETPGVQLQCVSGDLVVDGNTIVAKGADGILSKFDVGSPLVEDGVQHGVLSSVLGVYLKVAYYRSWIQQVTEI
ncbi:trypsin II-P29-like [Bicyclus anynana]|uniref:Trypsin II-P29-like n=1 Tax=Bicyclus anynana TaxID=110368 RepID=A0A6J1NTF4_BICAN|nr:trypsin II-P29-like [Bicyclus anynana]